MKNLSIGFGVSLGVFPAKSSETLLMPGQMTAAHLSSQQASFLSQNPSVWSSLLLLGESPWLPSVSHELWQDQRAQL